MSDRRDSDCRLKARGSSAGSIGAPSTSRSSSIFT
jgi:hypothetical protein